MSKLFGERLKKLRLEKGYYQADLADILKTKQTNISRWEKGEFEPSFEQLIEIAEFFDVSTDYLLGLES